MLCMAAIAALALSVSNTVSIRNKSTPPARGLVPPPHKRHAADQNRRYGTQDDSHLAEMLAVRFVGPMLPATNLGLSSGGVGVCALSGNSGGLAINFEAIILCAKIFLGNGGGVERIGADDVASGGQITVMHLRNDIGLCDVQNVMIALQRCVVLSVLLATKRVFG